MKSILIVFKYLSFIACLIFANTSLAHTKLQSTTPANQAVLTESPAAIELRFNKAVNLIKVSVKSGSKAKVKTEFVVNPDKAASFTIPFSHELFDDDYSVRWVIIGADGHKVDGEFGFVLNSGQ